MARKPKQDPHPPKPPEITRKPQFHRIQLIGLPLILLIPVLALFGTFGETADSVSTASTQIEVRVEYPTRFRYKLIHPITVSLHNASEQSFGTVQVGFEREYVESFSVVTFTPTIRHITDTFYYVEINDLGPGETRIVIATVQADQFGNHSGKITVTPDNAEELEMSISTFSFP